MMLFAMEAMRIIFSFLLALVVFMTTFVVAGGIAVLITNYYIAPFLAETFVNARRWWAGRSANIDVLKGGEPPNEGSRRLKLPTIKTMWRLSHGLPALVAVFVLAVIAVPICVAGAAFAHAADSARQRWRARGSTDANAEERGSAGELPSAEPATRRQAQTTNGTAMMTGLTNRPSVAASSYNMRVATVANRPIRTSYQTEKPRSRPAPPAVRDGVPCGDRARCVHWGGTRSTPALDAARPRRPWSHGAGGHFDRDGGRKKSVRSSAAVVAPGGGYVSGGGGGVSGGRGKPRSKSRLAPASPPRARRLPRPPTTRAKGFDITTSGIGKRKGVMYSFGNNPEQLMKDVKKRPGTSQSRRTPDQQKSTPINKGDAVVPWAQVASRVNADKHDVEALFSSARPQAHAKEPLSSTPEPAPPESSATSLPVDALRLASPRLAAGAAPTCRSPAHAHTPESTSKPKATTQLSPPDAVPPTAPNTPPVPILETGKETPKLGDLTPVDQGEIAHCCTVEPKEETEGWVQAPYREDEEGQEVPGALVYLPVTILRPTGREASTAAEETVYVRPGGGRETSEWAQEYMRVIWEVPRSAITDKVPAEAGARCDSCREAKWGCSWTPDGLDLLCNYCADAPRRAVVNFRELRGYGRFTWASSCDCRE